jgi:NADH oxidase (H2O2-forming)
MLHHGILSPHRARLHVLCFDNGGGKTTRATQCELGQLEIIERDEGGNYLRIATKEGRVVGGQATDRFGDFIGLFIGAMWRKDDIAGARANWPHIARKGSSHPWIIRRLGELSSA